MKASLFSIVLSVMISVASAQRISIDVAGARNQTQKLNGSNLSLFYHFTEMFSCGLEVNRFFVHQSTKENSKVFLSAWDYEFNIHYYIPFYKKLHVYSVAGVSYSIEKEETDKIEIDRNWYGNTGAGFLLNTKTVKPHLEYIYAIGTRNEHFFIAGITIEIDLKNKRDHQ